MKIYDFIKTHTIDEIAEEVVKDLDAGTDLQTLFGIEDITNTEECELHSCGCLTPSGECACLALEKICPCLKEQKEFIKKEIIHMLNYDV